MMVRVTGVIPVGPANTPILRRVTSDLFEIFRARTHFISGASALSGQHEAMFWFAFKEAMGASYSTKCSNKQRRCDVYIVYCSL